MKLLCMGRVTALDAAMTRLERLQASPAGPFDLCLIADLTDEKGLASLLDKSVALPMPIAFLSTAISSDLLSRIEATKVERLTYLQGLGEWHFAGVRIVYSDSSATKSRQTEFCDHLAKEAQERPHRAATIVDVLLTPYGATGVWALASPAPPAEFLTHSESTDAIRTLSELCEPRYHFFPASQYLQRPPYANSNSGICTRVVAIAEFSASSDGKAERKNIHAVNIAPAAEVDLSTLTDFPEGSTASPFAVKAQAPVLAPVKISLDGASRPISSTAVRPAGSASHAQSAAVRAAQAALSMSASGRAGDAGPHISGNKRHRTEMQGHLTEEQVLRLQSEGAKGSQYFWNVHGGRGGGRAGGPRREGGVDPGPCWFCLASPQVEKHLVVSIGTETYLALPKGGITDFHVLVVPIQHHTAFSVAPKSVREETQTFLTCFGRFLRSKDMGMVVFERVLHSRRGDIPLHTHLQVLGIPLDVAKSAETVFVTEGKFRHMAFETLPADVQLHTALGELESEDGVSATPLHEYFYVEVPTGEDAATPEQRPPFKRLLHRIPEGAKHPVQFGREVLCRLLGMPERLQWKDCAVGTAAETKQTEALRSQFAPFDFTLTL